MRSNILETLAGALVLLIAAGFIVYAYRTAGVEAVGGGYEINASFISAGGLAPGADVRVSGVKVGAVQRLVLDKETFEAKAVLQISEDLLLPEDTSARIASDGLLGRSYVALEPGGSPDSLAAGDEISITAGPINLMTILGQAISSFGGGSGGN